MGFHLKNLRKSKHLSQRDLSELSGVSCGYISEIETNKAKHVSVEIMEKIADTLGVKLKDIIEFDAIPMKNSKKPEIIAKTNLTELAEKIHSILYHQLIGGCYGDAEKHFSLAIQWAMECAQMTIKTMPKDVAIQSLQSWLAQKPD